MVDMVERHFSVVHDNRIKTITENVIKADKPRYGKTMISIRLNDIQLMDKARSLEVNEMTTGIID